MAEFITVNQAAEMFQRSPQTIYRWIEEGFFLEIIKIKNGYLIPQKEVKRIIKNGKVNNYE